MCNFSLKDKNSLHFVILYIYSLLPAITAVLTTQTFITNHLKKENLKPCERSRADQPQGGSLSGDDEAFITQKRIREGIEALVASYTAIVYPQCGYSIAFKPCLAVA